MATIHFLEWVERQANRLRACLNLMPMEVLDPYLLADKFGALILTPRDILGSSNQELNQLLVHDSSSWSAGSIRLPTGKLVIVLNPTHAETRKRATLMEEISHIHLNHKPSKLILQNNGLAFRSFKKSQETEAYWVGAAALVPLTVLNHARTNSVPKSKIASQRGVSLQLVTFRERVTGVQLK